MGTRRPTAVLAIAAAFACLSLLWVGGAAAAAKEPQAHASVIGGHSASIEELPWLAYIQAETGSSGYSCSGTVVAPRIILTAGHCVEDIESGEITAAAGFLVATGVADLEDAGPGNVSRVLEALVYPGFDPGQVHGDAGILILSAPVSAPAIRLASAADAGLLEPRTPLTVAGWGLTKGNAKDIPTQLQEGTTTVQPKSLCDKQVRRYYPFYSPGIQLCALDKPSYRVGVCHGDSGGPAIATAADGTPVEVGINSMVGPGCTTKAPNVFTRVDRVSEWVGRWIAAVEAGGPRPTVKVPKVRTPTLTVPVAEELAAVGFAHDFKAHFVKASERRIRCARRAKAKVKCQVSWYQGGDDYWGDVTVYYKVVQNSVLWGFNYTINWVNNRCYFYSGHRASCKIHTKLR